MGTRQLGVSKCVALGILVLMTGCGMAQVDVQMTGDQGIVEAPQAQRVPDQELLEDWAWNRLEAFDWEEYHYDKPSRIESIELRAMVRGEDQDDYEVRLITVRPVTSNPELGKIWPMLYPHRLEDVDQIRLEETYWISFEPVSRKLEGQKDAPIYRRLPFDETAMPSQEIQQGFLNLLKQPAVFFEDYKRTLTVDESQATKVMKNAVKQEVFYLPPDQMKRRYPASISPYGLGKTLSVDEAGIVYEISPYATQKQPKYQISVPVSLLLNHYKRVYYRYNYVVGTENGQIEWIRLESVMPEAP